MNELDKTIEELEAEVLAELEEAKGADAPVKGAVPAQKADTLDKNKEDESPEDLGGPTPEKDAMQAGKTDSAKKIKKDASAPTKGATPAEKADTVKEEDEAEGESLDEMKMPKTKKEMLNAMYEKMCGENKEKLMAMYKKVMEEEEEDDDDNDMGGMEEHLNALISGEELSEEFQEKAATIFEAAVKSKVAEKTAIFEEEYQEKLEESVQDIVEKVDSYLNYVTEEWVKENELAIERGLKSEIVEDFMTGLKGLFEEHYIDVPDEKYDILEAQQEKIEELESRVNGLIESEKESHNRIGELVRESLIAEAVEEMTDTESEKFRSLVEDVDFTGEETFKSKLETLKESYFPTEEVVHSLTEEHEESDDIRETSDTMAAYLAAITKSHNRAQ